MTTPLKILIMLGLWGLYSLIAWFGCLSGCCGAGQSDASLTNTKADAAVTAPVVANEIKRYPVDFQWSNPAPNTNEGFETRKQAILAGMKENNILDITGYYYEGEDKPANYDNMGFARANQIKTLFGIDLPEDRIRFHARLQEEGDNVKTGYFEGFEYKWVEAETKAVAETVEELEDRIIIRFPFASVEKEYSPEVDSYLEKLAERVAKTKERIVLTGHTDAIGEPSANLKLGQGRADQIKQILIKHGVDGSLIDASSKGESQHVAPNNTDEGRHENRRVEVRYIKN